MSTSNRDKFLTVANQPVTVEIKVKGSRFIGHIFHAPNRQQAESIYLNIRRQYHDATHNCYAYRMSADEFRYSDDGEPSGTAGRPIYQVLEKNDLIQTIIIVTRYFGGTKLGTGGLRRAYSSCALTVLSHTKVEIKFKFKTVTVEADYNNMNILLDTINKYSGIIGKTEYTDIISYCIQIPVSKIFSFRKDLEVFEGRGIKILGED